MITTLPRCREVNYGLNRDQVTQYSSDFPEKAFLSDPGHRELHIFFGYNEGPDQWLFFYDLAAVAAPGSTPRFKMRIASDENFGLSLGGYPWIFQNGIYICNSTTKPSLTLGAADCNFNVQYD